MKGKGGGEEEVVGWEMGGEEEEEGRVSLATFRFALIKATWSSPQNTPKPATPVDSTNTRTEGNLRSGQFVLLRS